MFEHYKICLENSKNLKENIDYVVCKICNTRMHNLGTHVNSKHNISSKQYIRNFPSSKIISHKYYEICKSNAPGNSWINKMKASGFDLKGHYKQIGLNISKSIMSNDLERKRRSNAMKKILLKNIKDPNYIKKLSDSAKKTSARKDIQENRAKVLKKWRDNNRVKFNRILKNMISKYRSKGERKLMEFLKTLDGFSFKRNRFLKSPIIPTKTNKKQIDIGDDIRKIYFEYDGPFHFKKIRKDLDLEKIKAKDEALDKVIESRGYTLVRVGYDQFIDKNNYNKCGFTEECLNKIKNILASGIPGVYKIGEMYV